MHWHITMTGDAAVTVSFSARIDADVSTRVVAVADAVRAAGYPGVRDVVPTYHAVTVYIDPLRADLGRLWTGLEDAAAAPLDVTAASRDIVVPVVYGGDRGPDLSAVARFAGLSHERVIELHTGRRYRVYMLGFLAGFPYMGAVDSRIAIPRRNTPRTGVAAGSVGIAGEQTGVYPASAPGGWHVIGRATVEPFDPSREPPCPWRPGDLVTFESVREVEGS
jgi:KipI family sensor histidine kinase inhibitor